VLQRVQNVDQMLRDVEFQQLYTLSELARLKQFIEDSKNPSILIARSTLAFLVIQNFCSLRQIMVGATKVSNIY
jgi:hypothetical protein